MGKKGKSTRMFGPPLEEPENVSIGWSPEYEIGIDVIDQQHKRYYELVSRYLDQMAEPADDEDTIDFLVLAFEFMVKYADEHFAAEESIMKRTGFPGYAEHLEEHDYFRSHIARLLSTLQTKGLSLEVAREVNFYAIEWFTTHIISVDAELGDYLKQNGHDIDLETYRL